MSEHDHTPAKHDPDSLLSQSERRARMRLERDSLIEELISEGREQGLFDDLPGKGKPLQLDKNLFAPELDLAHSLLKDNEMAPAWITERSDLLAQIRALRDQIRSAWQRQRRAFELQPEQQDRISNRWYDACRHWDQEITDLNKKIDSYNLKRPLEHLEIFKLALDGELQRIGSTRWLRPQ